MNGGHQHVFFSFGVQGKGGVQCLAATKQQGVDARTVHVAAVCKRGLRRLTTYVNEERRYSLSGGNKLGERDQQSVRRPREETPRRILEGKVRTMFPHKKFMHVSYRCSVFGEGLFGSQCTRGTGNGSGLETGSATTRLSDGKRKVARVARTTRAHDGRQVFSVLSNQPRPLTSRYD